MAEEKEGILTASDVAMFMSPRGEIFPDDVARKLNEIIEKRIVGKKMAGVIDTSAAAKVFPVVTLQVRMQEMIKGMVQSMLLDEQEVKELTLKAIKAAVDGLDWGKEARKTIEEQLKYQLSRSIEGALHSLFWDKNVLGAMKVALIRELQKPEER